jgi:hypothetical protein
VISKRIAVLAAVVALVAAAGVATTLAAVAVPSEQQDRSAMSTLPARCSVSPVPREEALCDEITVDGRSYRYSLLAAAGGATQSTVVMDIGGPGASVLANPGVTALAAQLPGALRAAHNVLIVEEPWVTRPVTEACRTHMAVFYGQFRAATPVSTARDLIAGCQLDAAGSWGFAPGAYSRVLDEVERARALSLSGFVGASFASARWAGAGAERFAWSVLLQPYPLGVPGDQLLGLRAAAVLEQTAAVKFKGDSERASHPFDLVSARVSLGKATGEEPVEAGELSDSYWQRYGDGSVSPAFLAYWDETCRTTSFRALPAWSGKAEDVRSFLSQVHLPCAELEPNQVLDWPQSDRLCVTVSDTDTVAPAAPVRSAVAGIGGLIVEVGDAGHTPGAGLNDCLRLLGLASD